MTTPEQVFVCILEEEFERLKRNENFLFTSKETSKDNLNSIRSEIENELKIKLNKIEKRQIEYRQFLNDLNGDLKYIEIENQRRFKAQDEKINILQNNIGLIKNSAVYYLDLLKKQELALIDKIETDKKEVQDFLEDIDSKLQLIINNELNKKEKVKVFISDLQKLITESEKLFSKNTSYLRILNTIKDQVLDSLNDLRSGFFESSFVVSKNAYQYLNDLRNEFMEEEKKVNILQATIVETIYVLLKKIELNTKHILTIDNEKIELDLNFWSYNDLATLKKDLKKLVGVIYDITELKDLNTILNSISGYEDKLQKIISQAKEEILNSQIRYNISAIIANILVKNFFSLQKAYYDNNDKRESYLLEFNNLLNENLVIKINKDIKNISKINLSFQLNSKSKLTFDFIKQVIKELIQAEKSEQNIFFSF